MRCRGPKYLDRLIQRRLHVLALSHVAPNSEHRPAEVLNPARRFLVAPFGHIGDHDAGALARECQSCGTADVAPRAGHEDNLACKASICFSPCLFLDVGHLTVVVDVMGGGGP